MSKCFVNVCGGIGNQLFQIATGYAYSKKYDKELVINASNWHGHQGIHSLKYKDTIFKNFKYGIPVTRDIIGIHEQELKYSELEFKLGNVALNGYFQSLKYFDDYKAEFISKLCLPTVKTSILGNKTVAFHIRRGDYLKFSNVHYVCDTNHFNKMFETFDDYTINVFTDSPEHVLKEFEQYNFNLIQTSSELNDLTLMSLHDNIVCSNSSFSWWASILGSEKNKIIVPSRWFNDRECDDIYYDGMIKI
jgi:hypothetical protein